jgi:hypothetical protein
MIKRPDKRPSKRDRSAPQYDRTGLKTAICGTFIALNILRCEITFTLNLSQHVEGSTWRMGRSNSRRPAIFMRAAKIRIGV